MRQHLRLRPEVERLEAVALLSGASAAVAAMPVAVTTPVATHTIMLSGTVTGNYHAKEIPDAGKFYTFFGHGHVSPLNHVVMSGNVALPGLIVTPEAHGQIFLSDARGSVTLTLAAPSKDNATSLPPYFFYKITNASGAFKGDTGSGFLTIAVKPAPTPVSGTMPVGGGEHGTFTPTFLAVPPPSATG